MAATRGPVPKRSTERRRRNKDDTHPEAITVGGPHEAPEPDEDWDPIALEWYRSLAGSAQALFFEPSDWQAARYVAVMMTRSLTGKVSAQLFSAIWSAMGELLTTEGARRRVRFEVERTTDVPDGVAVMEEYRQALEG